MAPKYTKLTKENMKALAPGKRIVERGIVYTKLDNGDGRFEICIQVNKERVHRSVGRESEGVTRAKVEAVMEQVRADVRSERFAMPKARKTHLGFKEAAEKYVARLNELAGKNVDRKEAQFRLHLVPFFRNQPVTKLTSFDLERYKKHRKDQGATVATINRELAVVSHMLNMALDWGWITHVPCRVKLFKEERTRFRFLSQEEIDRLLAAAEESSCLYLYPFIRIALGTSMRSMEILSLQVEAIDLEQGLIYLDKAKAGARVQPMLPSLVEYLRSYITANCEEGQVWLFPALCNRNGNATHFKGIEKPFRKAVEEAGMDPKEVVRHTLRHTVISHLVQAGVDLSTVKKISGHASLQMVERYTHLSDAHIQDALGKLEERYLEKPEAEKTSLKRVR